VLDHLELWVFLVLNSSGIPGGRVKKRMEIPVENITNIIDFSFV